MSAGWECPQLNKFKQVSSLSHHVSLAGGGEAWAGGSLYGGGGGVGAGGSLYGGEGVETCTVPPRVQCYF